MYGFQELQEKHDRNLGAMLRAIGKYRLAKGFWKYVKSHEENLGKGITISDLAEQYCVANAIPWENFIKEETE